MSDRFIKFNDEQLDAKQVMMLQDLHVYFLKMSKRKLKYKNSLTIILIVIHSLRVGFGLIDRNILNNWTKTDVLLATYGYLNMNLSIINQVLHNNDFEHPKFFHQLFKLLEDVRIFEHIRQQRPSTTKND